MMTSAFKKYSFTIRMLVLALMLALGFAFGGCKKETKQEELVRQIKERDEKSIQDYLAHNNLTGSAIRTSSGLYYIIDTATNGEQATKGKTVEVDYIGKFINGNTFDSSYANARPLIFTLGRGEVIAGWDEGIALMKEGEKFKLIVPSQLGYGIAGTKTVPPNAILIFDTVLKDVR